MVFSNLKGFFYYRHIVRKEFLTKLVFLQIIEIPKLTGVKLSIVTNQKLQSISINHLYSWVVLLELLANQEVKCIKNMLFVEEERGGASLPDYEIFVYLDNIFLYEIFFRIKYIWFKGLVYNVEDYVINEAYRVRLKKKNYILSLEYLEYKEPVFLTKKILSSKKLVKESMLLTTVWSDFSFCRFVPITVIDFCVNFKFYIQFTLNIKNLKVIKLFLSSMNLFHRFFPPRKK